MRRYVGAALGMLLIACGCSQGPTVVPISGKVTRKGEPVPNLVISFVPDVGRPSWALLDERGEYYLEYDAKREGAITGSHRVFFSFRPKDPKEESEYLAGKLKLHKDLKAILDKYGKLETTPLRYEITTANPQLNIELE